MKKNLIIFAIVGLAILAGAGSAMVRLLVFPDSSSIRVGPWRTSPATGSENAGPTLRAIIAANGLLALTHKEAIYFVAATDSSGSFLSGSCRYRVEGRDPDARWWSLTVYGLDRFLIPNPAKRYSASGANVTRDAQGRFTIRLASAAQAGNWIFVVPGHQFLLNLRAYNPSPAMLANPGGAELPSIIREGCA